MTNDFCLDLSLSLDLSSLFTILIYAPNIQRNILLSVYLLMFCMTQASATPLQRAAAEGHVDIVHQLLKHGADVNHQDVVVWHNSILIRVGILSTMIAILEGIFNTAHAIFWTGMMLKILVMSLGEKWELKTSLC